MEIPRVKHATQSYRLDDCENLSSYIPQSWIPHMYVSNILPRRPSVLTYQPSQLIQFQMQYNATLPHPGNETFVMPHLLSLIPQLHQYQFSAGPYQDRENQTERGRYKAAALTKYQLKHASCSTVENDGATLHHSHVGGFHKARSGSAGGPLSSGVFATAMQKQAVRGQHNCDNLLQDIAANEGEECMWNSNFHF